MMLSEVRTAAPPTHRQPQPEGRLVVVSNRVTPATRKQATQAGGLAVGILSALRERGGLWFGWSGDTVEGEPGPVRTFSSGAISYALLDLNEDEFEAYYANFSNRTLWPLFHYRIDLTTFEHEWWGAYCRINRLFAERLKPMLRPGDTVWVHDYHLILLGAELREMGVDVRIGYFLHIPFPALEMFVTLPWHRELAYAMCAYDLIGFQTSNDTRHFTHYVQSELGGIVDIQGNGKVGDVQFRAKAIPIGIDADEFAEMSVSNEAQRQSRRVAASLGERALIIGVDRLDYTKGIPERLLAIEALLTRYPTHRSRVTCMQISAPSRTEVPEYRRLRIEIETLSGHLNGIFSEADWAPLRYLNRSFSRTALAGYYRLARIGLVTPLRDGMNLVAKEFVAAQDPEDPGVLVLSRFAGAASDLVDGALIVNPYDVLQVARAIDVALNMPLDERKDRHRRMLARVRQNDVTAWWKECLMLLAEPVEEPRGAP